MTSDGHRANLLNDEIKEIAVGFPIDDKSKETYWIQEFANPASKSNNYALLVDIASFAFSTLLCAEDGFDLPEISNIENPRGFINEFGLLFKARVELIAAFPMISSTVVPAWA